MQLPRILKSFNVFTDGLNKDGVLMTVKRPDIKFKTEDYTPGGGMGEFTVIHGIEKLELELTSKGFDLELFKSISHKINGNLLRYQGALHKEDEETYQTLVGEARGRIIDHTQRRQSGRRWRADIQICPNLLERNRRWRSRF